jgi:hypothetical protein
MEPAVVIEGIGVANGAVGQDEVYPENSGGGLLCREYSSCVIRNCSFRSNMTWGSGGGIFAYASTARVEGCQFAENSTPVGNWQCGGGLAGTDSAVEISGCTFQGNWSGRGGGVALIGQDTAVFTGCVFLDNTAAEGSAVWLQNVVPHVEQCTLAFNWGRAQIGCTRATVCSIGATIVCGAGIPGVGSAVECDESSEAHLSCSDIFGNWSGDFVGCIQGQMGQDGNLSVDPLFCDAENRVIDLCSDSRCLPQGNSCGVQIGARASGCGECQLPIPVLQGSWGRIKLQFH